MSITHDILSQYKFPLSIDIHKIVNKHWLDIQYIDFEKINGCILVK